MMAGSVSVEIAPETMHTPAFRPFRDTLIAALFAALSPFAAAQSPRAVDCGIARDPARCEAHQAALAACADLRGKAQSACLAEHMPPVDCSKASNPANCAAAERAKEVCKGMQGKALKQCLRESGGEKAAKPSGKTKKRAKSAKKKSRPAPK